MNKKGQQSQSANKHLFVCIGELLADYWLAGGLVLVSFAMAIFGLISKDDVLNTFGLDSNGPWKNIGAWGLLVGICAQAILSIWNLVKGKRLTALSKELDEAKESVEILAQNAQSVCEGFLQDLARGPLDFGAQAQNNERVTLYVHDSERHFQPIARFSFNQSFMKRGRSRYPENQGCIGRAWEHGWCFEILPTDSDEWEAACTEQGVPRTVAKALNMKSRLYCACAIQIDSTPKPIAVIVIESTDPTRYTEEQLEAVLTNDRSSYVGRLIEMLRPYLGDLGNARKDGF